jgi:hypothetical protein
LVTTQPAGQVMAGGLDSTYGTYTTSYRYDSYDRLTGSYRRRIRPAAVTSPVNSLTDP